MNIDHIIIGGGIAGCYIGLQLLQKNKSFIILESKQKGENWGKQLTINKDGVNIELGSSVIHSNQTNIIHMINMLGLHTEEFKPEKNTKTWNFISSSISKPIKEKCKLFVKNNKELSKHMTVGEIATLCCSQEEIEILKLSWFNWFESKDEIAFTYYTGTEREGTYLKIKEGFQSILTESKKRLPIMFDHKVISLKKENERYSITTVSKRNKSYKFNCTYCYFTVDYPQSKQIKLTHCPLLKTYLDLGIQKPSCRVYICFSNPVTFFDKKDDKKVINMVGGVGHWSFKISDKVWMLSYVDSSEVRVIHDELKQNKLIRDWIDFVYSTFRIEGHCEDYEVIGAFWEHAYTLLKPEYYDKPSHILEPNLICTTIPHPFNQAWSEGHLFNI
jgi:hypothetical protein